MKREPFPISEIKESLRRLEGETNRLMKLSKGIPGIEKNITPIAAFIDILKFHLDVDDEGDLSCQQARFRGRKAKSPRPP